MFLFSFWGSGVWTQCLKFARQVFYHLSHSTSGPPSMWFWGTEAKSFPQYLANPSSPKLLVWLLMFTVPTASTTRWWEKQEQLWLCFNQWPTAGCYLILCKARQGPCRGVSVSMTASITCQEKKTLETLLFKVWAVCWLRMEEWTGMSDTTPISYHHIKQKLLSIHGWSLRLSAAGRSGQKSRCSKWCWPK
jgi:hypothetical protein